MQIVQDRQWIKAYLHIEFHSTISQEACDF